MKKKKLKQNVVALNLKKDLGLDQDITVEFWKDPSRSVIFDLINIVGASRTDSDTPPSDEESEKMHSRYFECASLMIVDSDVEGLDFSTPESTAASFDDERIPWGTFHMAMLIYLSRLTDEYEVLKNALRRVKELSASGSENQSSEESQ